MATTLTKETFSSTYKDDFADSAGYHKILFNSGKSLQARELTQLQTILQTQISHHYIHLLSYYEPNIFNCPLLTATLLHTTSSSPPCPTADNPASNYSFPPPCASRCTSATAATHPPRPTSCRPAS